ncbi:uncharacterized protein SOCE26_007150 [Sorangium cellulosum]|uniref:Uncharacterized protein n=1 Tax=Sorangium cellulosum TaxID=56 RepID=A0A2L0EJ58_SORCE|nr:hypothetical protein [Sorangium cellulosum]AUX39326.1 uncharacterized protein SOCE26_007150 [Sorangium cellulosum]
MRGALGDITKAAGHTPLVRRNRVAEGLAGDIYITSPARRRRWSAERVNGKG